MINKARGAIKALVYSLKYGNRIKFSGIPSFRKNVEINIKQGKMTAGKGFEAKSGTYIAVVNGGEVYVKKGVSFGRNCIVVCHSSIFIGESVCIGPNVQMFDHDHRFDKNGVKSGFRTTPISIGDNCWIGAGVTILRGTCIGEGCIIGAGCIVKGDIPPHSLVTGERGLCIRPIIDNCENGVNIETI